MEAVIRDGYVVQLVIKAQPVRLAGLVKLIKILHVVNKWEEDLYQ